MNKFSSLTRESNAMLFKKFFKSKCVFQSSSKFIFQAGFRNENSENLDHRLEKSAENFWID